MISVLCQKIRQFKTDRAILGQVLFYLSFSKLALVLGQKGKTNYEWLRNDAVALLEYVNLYGE